MKYLFFTLIIVSTFACRPCYDYIGEYYPAKTNVDVYYDESDIEVDYKVMGLLTNQNCITNQGNDEKIHREMIEKAKKAGADAILFLGIYNETVGRNNTTHVDAKLIRYR